MRGLDYYSRTAFEFLGPDESAQASTICGGGRYDYLVEEIGGPPTPGIGFGAGIERLVLSLELEGIAAEQPRLDVFVAAGRGSARRRSCRDLRAAGIAADTDYAGRSLKGQIGYGQKHADATLILDGDGWTLRRGGELDVTVRDVDASEGAAVSWRDTTCGALRAADAGRRVILAGWADTRRDHGGLVFVDLRDYSGKVQLVINPEHAPEAAEIAHGVRNEFVLQAEGEVVLRAPDAVNPNLPTGEVEVQVDMLRIVSPSDPLPFQIGDESVDEVLRLRYRYLDMRGERMQRNLRLNHTIIGAIRREMDALGFVDVWTPSMTKGTPEGARDFLVPVRLQPGRFFALAQSPQLFKQLTMIGGLDRYYQIATCWRDEDLRADRQFEFRQLDLEMSFVEREDVLDVLERCMVASFEARRTRAAGAAVPAHVVRRGDGEVRHRQAGPPLRARDPGCDGDHARLPVRRLRRRARRPLPRRAAGVLARGAGPPRGDREGVGREGARLPRHRRVRRGALADREVPLRAGARRLRDRSRARRCSSPPARRATSPACSAACAPTSAASSSSRSPEPTSSTG